ncbi:PREDICTED: eukaryotic translation initiation factor 3 subunit A isoform X2 [Tarenaya hassleriana]|uniref:eukaryotic translation initiation factor 3 subunit A isoform X2 n=1 Tax=Tarenaya hassleriana TaxID=28532 RepID=UPI00053C2DF1|nr:PREDICTED: eukaryotic translation initiation factor 3 subunit A isoform X2 [Tarenaya hassleriana]
MATFAKPENALKRADELINVGQKQDALQALHDLITSKRYRAWQKPLEKIMFKYLDLCVDLRRGRFAKDGLIQYRIVCQQVNVSSLEEVIKHFLHLATEKAEQARSQAEALEEALDVDDLEADKRPEDLMLSIVSGEKGKDRSDRELVTPWFKFLWETYRTVLEILRNNSKLEALYAMTAHRAFQFCKQYKRTTEFRRLCEIIRNHLANLNKYRDQRDRPDLSAPESLQLYLETRFEQLKVATELGLWQEAFRSVEDIYGLMCMVKKTPKSSLLMVYYSKLTEIFWISSSHLYHAYAWFKLFSLQKNFNKNLSQKDLQLIASSVVLAALSVPPFDHALGASHLELENEKERNLRMANLIGFNLEPKFEGRDMLSRSALLSELVSRGVLSCATQEVKDLFHLLEHEFHPLDLGSKSQPLLDKISKLGGKLSSAPSLPEVKLSQYVSALEKLATLRLLQQVSQIYQTIKIESLSQLIPFFDFSVVEKISVDAVKNNFTTMKVDHMKGVVIFGNLGIESDGLRDHLAILAESLNKVRAMLYPAPSKASKLGDILPTLGETVEKEHKRLIARKTIIEKRKEELERHQLEMEREEEQRRLKLQRITEEAEQKRLAAELEERRRQRILREIEERELEEAQALLEDTEKRLKKGKKKTLLDGEKVTKKSVMARALSEQLKERQEMEKKLQKLAKTMDYLERAKREEAAPLIEAAYQRRLVEERELHEREQQREVELSRERHESDLKEKNRLARMLDSKNVFQERVIKRRQAEFDRLRAEKEERINQIIQARKQERDIKRKQIFYLTCEEERITKLREEEESRKREEAERKRKEEAERKAKLDEIAEKQRQREREAEEKERLRRDALMKPTEAPPPRFSEPAIAAPAAVATAAAAAPAAAPASAPNQYVPRFRLQTTGGSGSGSGAAAPPPAESDRWGGSSANRAPPAGDDHWGSRGPPSQRPDRWASSRAAPPAAEGGDRWGGPRGERQSDTWRGDDRRPSFGSGSRGSLSSRYSQR